MVHDEPAISFGPVPSRRLGRSLGVNNIPPKHCTYSCVYCQLGQTLNMTLKRATFYGAERTFDDVARRVDKLEMEGERVDFIAFVPDGEPTLDLDLREEIAMLEDLGYPLGVITNSSLIWEEGVFEALLLADWVSLKVDAASEEAWRRIDRPHGKLDLDRIVEGMRRFSRDFGGYLCTETMLIEGLNDSRDELEGIASIICDLSPERAYLTLPLRPPAEPWVKPPDAQALEIILKMMLGRGIRAEMLSDLIDGEFSLAGDLRDEILRITSVHPIDREGMLDILRRTGSGYDVIEELLQSGELVLVELGEKEFFKRNLQRRTSKK